MPSFAIPPSESYPAHPGDPRFAIRRMRAHELQLALGWAAGEGWNPGLDDARPFFAADPDGFFMGTWDGEPVGCISAVAYDLAFGFIGLYLLRPEWRGKGFGLRLWNAAMAYLGARNIGLDGVLAQQDNYRKSGFALAYRNVRYEGIAMNDEHAAAVTRNARDVPFTLLADYDATLFQARRTVFLRAWLDQPHAHARAAVDEQAVRGYGVIRECLSGYKIGPLFADDPATARKLYRALTNAVAGQSVFLDVPERNGAATALAAEYGMTRVFETARMYTRRAPDVPVARVFGVTSFELG